MTTHPAGQPIEGRHADLCLTNHLYVEACYYGQRLDADRTFAAVVAAGLEYPESPDGTVDWGTYPPVGHGYPAVD